MQTFTLPKTKCAAIAAERENAVFCILEEMRMRIRLCMNVLLRTYYRAVVAAIAGFVYKVMLNVNDKKEITTHSL